eukprot:scaffold296_cov102-Amphora_coffeaeformis.AAC.31
MPLSSSVFSVYRDTFLDLRNVPMPDNSTDVESLTLRDCLFDGLRPSALAVTPCVLLLLMMMPSGLRVAVRDSVTTGPAVIYFVHNTSYGRMLNNYLGQNPWAHKMLASGHAGRRSGTPLPRTPWVILNVRRRSKQTVAVYSQDSAWGYASGFGSATPKNDRTAVPLCPTPPNGSEFDFLGSIVAVADDS